MKQDKTVKAAQGRVRGRGQTMQVDQGLHICVIRSLNSSNSH